MTDGRSADNFLSHGSTFCPGLLHRRLVRWRPESRSRRRLPFTFLFMPVSVAADSMSSGAVNRQNPIQGLVKSPMARRRPCVLVQPYFPRSILAAI
jgi:hypothetical protein